ncbi:MAG: outer membrane protein assembly factor BamA [Syntrophobacteraceae bacterium]
MVGWRRVGGLVWLFVFVLLAVPTGWCQDQPTKVAVLPFVIHGQQDVVKAQKSLDEVFTRLLAGEGIKLIDPQEAERTAGGAVRTEEQARSVGGKLGAAYVLFGSFNQIGNSISLDAKLVDISGKKKTVVLFAEEKGMENLPSAAGKIVRQMSVQVLSKAVIADIKVRGNDRIEADAIKGSVKSKKGELLKTETVSEDLRSIHKMGFFEKVDAEVADSPEGKVLTFVVQENPSVQEVRISGQKKIKEKDILAAISTKAYTVLQRNVVSEDVQKIIKLYQQKGYYNAVVNSKIEFPKDPRKALVVFDIKENHKVYIKKINFSGNKNISGRKLRSVMQTKQKSILSYITDRGILQKDILETDIDRITAFFHDEGYMDAKVGSPDISLKDDGFYISITLDEGARYKVTSIKITGDVLEGYEKKIMKNLQLKPKSYFSREKVRKDIDTVTKGYMNEGYARVEVDPQIKRNQEDHTTDVVFNVVKKDVIRIAKIYITGNTKTRDNVIRRELKIAEGTTFSAKKIEDSLAKLKKLDFFEDVSIAPTDTDQKDVMNLLVKVKEKPTGSISVGGGFSSDDGLFTSGQIMQKNLFGKGEVVALKGYLGQEAQRYMLSFTEPWIFGRNFSAGVDIYNWIRAYEDFTKDAYGGRLRGGFPFGQYSRVNLFYVFERAHLTDLSAVYQELGFTTGYEIKSAIGAGFERDTTDHPFLPTKGAYIGAISELSTRAFGSDTDFLKHEYHAGYYHPLFWVFIGHIRGEMGFMHELVGTNSIPVYENFFLGGINSLRGFQFGQVGPREFLSDGSSAVVGGDKYAVANFEVLFPIMEKMGIRGVVFFDAGNAYASGESIDVSKFRTDIGAGIRWNSPFGPLRIEIGYNLDQQFGEEPYQWQFSAGAFF